MRRVRHSRCRWAAVLLGIMLIIASCGDSDAATTALAEAQSSRADAATALAKAQASEADAAVALAEAQAAATAARSALSEAEETLAAADLAQASAEADLQAAIAVRAVAAQAHAAAEEARSEAAAAQTEADALRDAADQSITRAEAALAEEQAAADAARSEAAVAQAEAAATLAAAEQAVAAAEAALAEAQAAADAARSEAAAAQIEAEQARIAAAEAEQARIAAEAETAAAEADPRAAAGAPEPPPVAAPPPSPAAAHEELVLTIAVPDDIQSLDPCCTNFMRSHEAIPLLYDSPVIHDVVEQNGALVATSGDLLPRYFESWEAHSDGLAYTIRVRPGVTFDDGTEVTAETVRFMTERNLNTPGGGNWLLRNIAYISKPPEVLDRYTLLFTSDRVSPLVVEHFYMMTSAIIDPKLVEKYATEADPWAMEHFYSSVENPSGPYRIARRTPGQEVVFEKRENYWGTPPAYDRIVWRIVPSNAARVQLLKAGVIDVAVDLDTEDFAALEGAEGVNVRRFPSKSLVYMGMGNKIAPFDDKTVRQAVSYAVDYDGILADVYKGEAQRLYGPIANGAPLSLGNKIGYARDVEKARALLAEAGNDGAPVTLSIDSAKAEHELIAVRIQADLAEIGMDVEIERLPSPVYAERKVGDNRMQMFIDEGLPWIDDPNYTLSVFLLSGVFGNYTQYENERVDQIINEGWGILDRDARAAAFEEAQRIIVDDAPWVFLAQPHFKVAMRDDIGGYSLYPNHIPRFADLYPLDE